MYTQNLDSALRPTFFLVSLSNTVLSSLFDLLFPFDLEVPSVPGMLFYLMSRSGEACGRQVLPLGWADISLG